jgi:hypothetical protein
VLVQDRCMVCVKCTSLKNHFRHTRWYYLVTRLKGKLISIRLEIVLILTQDSCSVCAEPTLGPAIVLDGPDGTPRS